MKLMTVRLKISGRVQGVSFRYHTRKAALEHGVNGWVRNCPDGSVDAVLQGEEEAVGNVIRWCHNGPSAAWVDKVEVTVPEQIERYDGFTIRN
jgi:acylphosphatase